MSTDPNFDIAGDGGYTRSFLTRVYGTTATSSTQGGTTVQLIVNGQLQMAPANLTGYGTWYADAPLHAGANSVAAVETVGGAQQTSRGVTYDVVPQEPDVEFTPFSLSTNEAQLALSGTVTSVGGSGDVAGQLLTIEDEGTAIAQARVQQDGTWSTQATLSHLGLNHLTATMTDAAGNSGTGDALYTYTVTPPTVALSAAGGLTNRPAQVIGGTATSGDAISILDNGIVIDGFTVNASGTWSRPEALIAQGTNTVQAFDTSPAGNTGTSSPVTFTLDTLPPAVAITSGSTSTRAASATLTLAGTAEVGSAVSVYDDGAAVAGAAVGPDGTWSAQVALHAGPNGISAQATDAAGNVGFSDTVVDTLDTTPIDTTPINTPPPSAGGTAAAAVPDTTPPSVGFGPAPHLAGTTATLTGTASDAGGIRGVELFDGSTDLGAAQVDGDGGWTFSHDFGQGSYDHLTAVATDAAGNAASAAAPYGLDTVPSGRRSAGAVWTYDAGGAVTSVTTASVDGGIGAQTVSNGDGTATGTGYENGQSVFSIGNDVMTGNGYRESFVFQPNMGHARVTDFVVAGAGHDTLSLSHGDFDTVAQVLQSITTSHGAAVIHVTPDDTIRLDGVTKAQLAHHRGDFAFTG